MTETTDNDTQNLQLELAQLKEEIKKLRIENMSLKDVYNYDFEKYRDYAWNDLVGPSCREDTHRIFVKLYTNTLNCLWEIADLNNKTKFTDKVRDDNIPQIYGNALRNIAALAEVYGALTPDEPTWDTDYEDTISSLGHIIEALGGHLVGNRKCRECIEELWDGLISMCEIITGRSYKEIIVLDMTKL